MLKQVRYNMWLNIVSSIVTRSERISNATSIKRIADDSSRLHINVIRLKILVRDATMS